jgi:hypothetical protein
METKRKNREWSEISKVIKGIFRKPAKLLQKEKKQVAQLLDEKFPPTETTGETPDKPVSQISNLKYIPPLKRWTRPSKSSGIMTGYTKRWTTGRKRQ